MQKSLDPVWILCRHRFFLFCLLLASPFILVAFFVGVVLTTRDTFEHKPATPEELRADDMRQKLQGVEPDLVKVVQRASQISMHGFRIVQGKRSQVEQDRLYEQGRRRPGSIVTWTRNSQHTEGRAIDFQPFDVEGRPTWHPRAFESVAGEFKRAAAEVGVRIDWGYDLWGKDLGHIELTVSERAK